MSDRKGRFGDMLEEQDPVEFTLEMIGGRWKSVLLYHLLSGTKRFNELRKMCPKITQRALTLQLRELEEDGIILRKVYLQVPPKVEYSLTEFGKTLAPILQLMKQWGEAYRHYPRNLPSNINNSEF